MTARADTIEQAGSTRLATGLWLAGVVPAVIGIAIQVSIADASAPQGYGLPGFQALFASIFASVGDRAPRRRPRGWTRARSPVA